MMKRASKSRMDALKGRVGGPSLEIGIDAGPSKDDASGGEGGLEQVIEQLKSQEGSCPPAVKDKYAQAISLLEQCYDEEQGGGGEAPAADDGSGLSPEGEPTEGQ